MTFPRPEPDAAEPETVIQLLSAQLAALQETAEAQQIELRRLRAERKVRKRRIEALLGSTSWRVSAPLRWLRRRFR